MWITPANPLAKRVLCYSPDGNLISHVRSVNLVTFEANDIQGHPIDVAEITIVHPTGRKLMGEERGRADISGG